MRVIAILDINYLSGYSSGNIKKGDECELKNVSCRNRVYLVNKSAKDTSEGEVSVEVFNRFFINVQKL